MQEASRPLCIITASSHAVPGGQLSFQPGTAGNDRIGTVPLERWDVDIAPLDNPAGEPACMVSFALHGKYAGCPQ